MELNPFDKLMVKNGLTLPIDKTIGYERYIGRAFQKRNIQLIYDINSEKFYFVPIGEEWYSKRGININRIPSDHCARPLEPKSSIYDDLSDIYQTYIRVPKDYREKLFAEILPQYKVKQFLNLLQLEGPKEIEKPKNWIDLTPDELFEKYGHEYYNQYIEAKTKEQQQEERNIINKLKFDPRRKAQCAKKLGTMFEKKIFTTKYTHNKNLATYINHKGQIADCVVIRPGDDRSFDREYPTINTSDLLKFIKYHKYCGTEYNQSHINVDLAVEIMRPILGQVLIQTMVSSRDSTRLNGQSFLNKGLFYLLDKIQTCADQPIDTVEGRIFEKLEERGLVERGFGGRFEGGPKVFNKEKAISAILLKAVGPSEHKPLALPLPQNYRPRKIKRKRTLPDLNEIDLKDNFGILPDLKETGFYKNIWSLNQNH